MASAPRGSAPNAVPRPSTTHRAPLSSKPEHAGAHNAGGSRHTRSSDNERRPVHSNGNHDEDCYVLTLLTDEAHYDTMTALRRQWFPQRLLKVDAHVTLFHALPGSDELPRIKEAIAEVATQVSRFSIAVTRDDVFKMGKGVGVNLCHGQQEAAQIRARLRSKWMPLLSEQDRRPKWRGHYTVMNKEDDKERVEECLEKFKDFGGSNGQVIGLRLWRYDRGWWRDPEDFHFRRS